MNSNYRRLAALVSSVAIAVGATAIAAPPAAAAPAQVTVDVVAAGDPVVDAGTGLATATYAITATNSGPSSLTHGRLTGDGAPDGTTATNLFIASDGNVPVSCTGGSTLTCTLLSEWKPGQLTVHVSFTLPVDDVESITYSAKVSGYSQTRSASSKSSFVDVPASETTTIEGEVECDPDGEGNRGVCEGDATEDGMTVSVTAPACTADSDTSCPSVRIWVDIVPGDSSACQPSTCRYGTATVYVDELGAAEDDRFCDDPSDPATCLEIVMSWPAALDFIDVDGLVTVHHNGQVVPPSLLGLNVLGCSPSGDDSGTTTVDEDACHATTLVDLEGNVVVTVYSYDNGGWGGS